MNHTAYLVGVIDIHAVPPKYLGSGIFSEPGPTVRGFPFVIAQADADNYASAHAEIEALVETWRYRWAKPLERK